MGKSRAFVAALATGMTLACLLPAQAQVQLIEDLLDVSRIITGNLRLDANPTPLGPVIEAALEAISRAGR